MIVQTNGYQAVKFGSWGIAYQSLGIDLTRDLRIYLGFPLIHKRLSLAHFKHVIDRVHSKLSGWKTKMLSMAGRCTLIRSTLSSIPSHSMQVCLLPKAVTNKLDKINRSFL